MNSDRVCKLCGVGLPSRAETGQRGGRLSLYCSLRCRQQQGWLVRRKLKPWREAACGVCGELFRTKLDHQRFCGSACYAEAQALRQARKWREQNPRPEVFTYTCDFCGLEFSRPTPLGGVKKFHRDCAVEARRARYRKKTVARQIAGVKPSGVSILRIVERDGWVCGVCGLPVDEALPRTSRMGATVDHIVPLSKGGSDELENLQLAHWICNNQKSNKVV